MSETGAIKFTCEHEVMELAPFAGFPELNACRRKLRQRGLIGVGTNGIAFGNLSVREEEANRFYVTGSGTGGLPELGLANYAKVTAFDFTRNWLRCEGRTIASAESLTHAAVYQAEAEVKAIIHCHSAKLWKRLLGVAPTTGVEVEYGTPEMADEVLRLFAEPDVRKHQLFVMAGHADGLIAFGRTLAEALAILTKPTDLSTC